MTSYAVTLVGTNDTQGRPEGSVDDAMVLKEGQTCPPGRTEMTDAELSALRLVQADAMAAWVIAQRLQQAKSNEVVRLKGEVTRLIEGRYSDTQQRSLLMLYQEASVLGYVNRRQQIQTALDWIKSVIAQYYVARDQVLAAATIQEATAVQLDAATLLAADPVVSLETVIPINN
jgi:hypothetical protein